MPLWWFLVLIFFSSLPWCYYIPINAPLVQAFNFPLVYRRFAKNLSPDKINLSTLKGEGQLTNLELDEEVLQSLLDLPTWLAINRVCCNKAAIRVSELRDAAVCELRCVFAVAAGKTTCKDESAGPLFLVSSSHSAGLWYINCTHAGVNKSRRWLARPGIMLNEAAVWCLFSSFSTPNYSFCNLSELSLTRLVCCTLYTHLYLLNIARCCVTLFERLERHISPFDNTWQYSLSKQALATSHCIWLHPSWFLLTDGHTH